MRYLATFISTTSFLLISAVSMFAQSSPPKLEVFGEAGISFISSGSGQEGECTNGQPCPALTNLTSVLTSSFSKTGRLVVGGRFRFTRHDALEASYAFSPNHLTLRGTETNPLTGLSEQVTGSSYNRLNLLSFNYVRYLWTRAPLQPFATGGTGLSRLNGPLNASAVTEGLTAANNGFQFAWNFGGGTDIVLQRHLAIRVELRDYLAAPPRPITGTSHNIVPSAGVVYRFK